MSRRTSGRPRASGRSRSRPGKRVYSVEAVISARPQWRGDVQLRVGAAVGGARLVVARGVRRGAKERRRVLAFYTAPSNSDFATAFGADESGRPTHRVRFNVPGGIAGMASGQTYHFAIRAELSYTTAGYVGIVESSFRGRFGRAGGVGVAAAGVCDVQRAGACRGAEARWRAGVSAERGVPGRL